jgi:hypothetical protein
MQPMQPTEQVCNNAVQQWTHLMVCKMPIKVCEYSMRGDCTHSMQGHVYNCDCKCMGLEIYTACSMPKQACVHTVGSSAAQ